MLTARTSAIMRRVDLLTDDQRSMFASLALQLADDSDCRPCSAKLRGLAGYALRLDPGYQAVARDVEAGRACVISAP